MGNLNSFFYAPPSSIETVSPQETTINSTEIKGLVSEIYKLNLDINKLRLELSAKETQIKDLTDELEKVDKYLLEIVDKNEKNEEEIRYLNTLITDLGTRIKFNEALDNDSVNNLIVNEFNEEYDEELDNVFDSSDNYGGDDDTGSDDNKKIERSVSL